MTIVEPQKQTVLDLSRMIERCLKELLKARRLLNQGSYKLDEDMMQRLYLMVEERLDYETVCQHISKTIIGELYELEMVNKLAPMFRMIPQLQADFKLLDDRYAQEQKLQTLRTEQL